MDYWIDIPKTGAVDEGCVPPKANKYSGKANTTLSGWACQVWNAVTPPEPRYTHVGGHNYCREPVGSLSYAWCFSTDPKKRYEDCGVSPCPPVTMKGKKIHIWFRNMEPSAQTVKKSHIVVGIY